MDIFDNIEIKNFYSLKNTLRIRRHFIEDIQHISDRVSIKNTIYKNTNQLEKEYNSILKMTTKCKQVLQHRINVLFPRTVLMYVTYRGLIVTNAPLYS